MTIITKIMTATIAISTASAGFSEGLSGFYLGGNAAYVGADTPILEKTNGATFGAFVGYNYVMSSNIVLGAELSYNLGKVKFDTPNNAYVSNYVDLKAKLGYQFSSDSMAYVFGGSSAAVFAADNRVNEVGGGMIWGLGYESMITNNISAGLEVGRREYNTLDDKKFSKNFYEDTSISLRAAYYF